MTSSDQRFAATLTRVGLPLTLVFAGVLTLAAGTARVLAEALVGAGVEPSTAVVVAVSGAGVVPLLIVGGLLLSHDPSRSTRRLTASGLTLMGTAVVAHAVTAPTGPGAAVVAVWYLFGLVVALTGVGQAAQGTVPIARDSGVPLSVLAQSSDRGVEDYPTDGGENDEDLNFPLDK